MKERAINKYEYSEHCFGKTIRINDVDIDDIPIQDQIELILDMITNSPNADSLRFTLLRECLDFIEFDEYEEYDDTCEQCGNWNTYSKSYNK